MKRFSRRQVGPAKRWGLGRVAALLAFIVVLSGGVAFAVLQSQQVKLTSNSVRTANAGLQLSLNGTTFTDSQLGFDFNGIVPGGPAVPEAGSNFWLKNTGGSPLNLKMTVTSTPSNPENVDLSKVNITLIPVGQGAGSQVFTLQSLLSSSTTGGVAINLTPLTGGASAKFGLQASMAADAISGQSATLGNIDFAFQGFVPIN